MIECYVVQIRCCEKQKLEREYDRGMKGVREAQKGNVDGSGLIGRGQVFRKEEEDEKGRSKRAEGTKDATFYEVYSSSRSCFSERASYVRF